MIWRQIHTLGIPWVPALNAEEQTRLTWAKLIQSYEVVPDVYKDFFEHILSDGQAFPYAVLAPSREGFIHRTTEKLVCSFGREIYVLERSENTFEVQCYPLEGISYVEVRTVLLDSHFKISGMTKQGIPASSTVKFNSVTDYLFSPILETIRLAAVDSRDAAKSSETDKFDHLVRLNYKFMNYAKRSLLGGEKVIHFILQPEIRVSVLRIPGKTYYKTISPTHMNILTDRELIIIREEKPQRSADRYGGIWDFIPLNKIVSLSLNGGDNTCWSYPSGCPKVFDLNIYIRLLQSGISINYWTSLEN